MQQMDAYAGSICESSINALADIFRLILRKECMDLSIIFYVIRQGLNECLSNGSLSSK